MRTVRRLGVAGTLSVICWIVVPALLVVAIVTGDKVWYVQTVVWAFLGLGQGLTYSQRKAGAEQIRRSPCR